MSEITTASGGEVAIVAEGDIVVARRMVRDAAAEIGLSPTDITRVVTAASELARNIFRYAGEGIVRWKVIELHGRKGIEVQFIDRGPGIPEVNLAMQEGYSTGGGLGMGLPGTKRLVDDMEIRTAVGRGTTVIFKKWRKP